MIGGLGPPLGFYVRVGYLNTQSVMVALPPNLALRYPPLLFVDGSSWAIQWPPLGLSCPPPCSRVGLGVRPLRYSPSLGLQWDLTIRDPIDGGL